MLDKVWNKLDKVTDVVAYTIKESYSKKQTQPPRNTDTSVSRKVAAQPSPPTKTTVATPTNSAQLKKKNSSGSEIKVAVNLPKRPPNKEQTESPQTTEINENKEESKVILETTNEVEIVKSPEEKPTSIDNTVSSESDSQQTASITITQADGKTIVTEGKEKSDG